MDALALGSEEGRDKLRKAAGIGKYELIRRYPNGATRQVSDLSRVLRLGRTWGTETSQYPQEKKTTVIPPVAASERGTAQTVGVSARGGVIGPER